MWQSAAIDYTVEELWPGSVLQRYDIASAAGSGMQLQGGQYFVWAVLFLIFFGLLFRGQSSHFFVWAGGFIKSPARRTYSDTSVAVRYGLPMSLAILLPLSALLLYGTGAVNARYPVILGCVCAYFALRSLISAGMAYVSGEKGFAASVNRMACVYLMVVVIFFCVVYILCLFVPDIYPVLMRDVVPVASGILIFVYLVEQTRIIFAFREPLLLSILYLCTLEILPIAIAVATILKF